MQAKSSFFVLQALDLATTLVAFHFGAFEVNPLVGRLTTLLGPTGGVLESKRTSCRGKPRLVIFHISASKEEIETQLRSLFMR